MDWQALRLSLRLAVSTVLLLAPLAVLLAYPVVFGRFRGRALLEALVGLPLVLHPEAKALIQARMQDTARERGEPYEPERPDNLHRLNMGVFPAGARIIPNSYNKIAGFSCTGSGGGSVHFVPGFPVMAWPMIEWVLDQHCAHLFHQAPQTEHSVLVFGAMEASLTPLMERIERDHAGVRVFSLPSVDHPLHGRHIELGVKGPSAAIPAAWADLPVK